MLEFKSNQILEIILLLENISMVENLHHRNQYLNTSDKFNLKEQDDLIMECISNYNKLYNFIFYRKRKTKVKVNLYNISSLFAIIDRQQNEIQDLKKT